MATPAMRLQWPYYSVRQSSAHHLVSSPPLPSQPLAAGSSSRPGRPERRAMDGGDGAAREWNKRRRGEGRSEDDVRRRE